MASHVYPKSRTHLFQQMLANTATASAGLYIVGVSSGYVYNAAHDNVSDLTNIVIAEQPLVDVAILASGAIDADDMLITGLTPVINLDALVVYAKWTGGDMLLAYIDQTSNSSLPQSVEDTQLQIVWDALGIFKI